MKPATFSKRIRTAIWYAICWVGVLCQLGVPPAAHAALGPIRLVVPFSPGSYTDNFARIVAPAFAEEVGASVVIDNRPGANGVIAADLVAKSPPDGSTFLLGGTSSVAINPGIYKVLPYDPIKDLVPVARSGSLPFLLIADPSVPISSVPDLIAFAKANPGKLAYATPNSSSLMGMELLKRTAGIDILSVPYKSSPQAILEMVAGRVQVQIADYGTAIAHVRAGKVKVLAVTMLHRTSLMPETATVDETLKSGFDISAWNGLLAPSGTSTAIVDRVATAWVSALNRKDVQVKLAEIGFDVAPMGAAAFGEYVRQQISDWGKLARELGVKAE